MGQQNHRIQWLLIQPTPTAAAGLETACLFFVMFFICLEVIMLSSIIGRVAVIYLLFIIF